MANTAPTGVTDPPATTAAPGGAAPAAGAAQPGAAPAGATPPAPAPAAGAPAAPATQAAPAGAPAGSPGTPAPAPAGAAPGHEGADPNWLKDRLDRAKKSSEASTRAALLAEMGVTTIDEAKAKVAKAKELEEAGKTELQKANERATALQGEAAKAARLGQIVTQRAAAEMASLTDAQQAMVRELAGEDPAEQLDKIDKLRKGGAIGAAPAAPAAPAPAGGAAPAAAPAARPPVPPPASTTAAGGAPPPATSESPNHKAVYEGLQKTNPLAAAQYLQRYEQLIYPATTQ